MLKEIITFVEQINEVKRETKSQQQLRKAWKNKKFVIIKTKEQHDNLIYDGLDILENDDAVQQWINKNTHYKTIMGSLNDYILPGTINKAIGSTSGLASYSFFVFKLSDKNLNKLKEKIDKTKFSDENDDKIQIKNIHKILKDASSDLTKKTNGNFKYLDFHALIHTNEKRFQEWKKVTDDYVNKKMSYGKATQRSEGKCFVCNKIGSVGTPIFLTNYDQAKTFLRHVTRNSTDNKGTSLFACGECIQKLNRFDRILKEYKIKIFPLFVESNLVQEEIPLLDHNLQESKNKFAFIFDQLKKRQGKNIFDFYLVVKSNEYFFFDYITGYKWDIGNYVNFFKNSVEHSITRIQFEMKIWEALSGNQHINYFDKIKGKDNQEISMIYSYRQKLFDFVYRNQNSLTTNDLRNIVLFRIEKEIRNNSNKPENCEKTLNLFFNKNLLLQTTAYGNDVLLNKIKIAKDTILSDNLEKFEIHDGEEWAYFAGQLAYYLVSLSKSKNKNYGLLEPFTNKSTTKLVKSTIEQLFERYKHEINLNNKRFKAITAKVLSYRIDQPFMELKIPFYVGVFDENVIYSKKEDKMVDI